MGDEKERSGESFRKMLSAAGKRVGRYESAAIEFLIGFVEKACDVAKRSTRKFRQLPVRVQWISGGVAAAVIVVLLCLVFDESGGGGGGGGGSSSARGRRGNQGDVPYYMRNGIDKYRYRRRTGGRNDGVPYYLNGGYNNYGNDYYGSSDDIWEKIRRQRLKNLAADVAAERSALEIEVSNKAKERELSEDLRTGTTKQERDNAAAMGYQPVGTRGVMPSGCYDYSGGSPHSYKDSRGNRYRWTGNTFVRE